MMLFGHPLLERLRKEKKKKETQIHSFAHKATEKRIFKGRSKSC